MLENESSFISVTDDEGNEYEFEILDETVVDNVRYFAMTEDTESEEPECFILKEIIDPATGETALEVVDDDAEYEKIAEIFDQQYGESLEDEDDDE